MRFNLILFLLILTASLFSQDLFNSPISNKSQKEVEQIFSEISSHNLVRSGFNQGKTISRLNRTIHSSGNMFFDSSTGIAWQVLKPFPSITVLTDNAMIQKSAGGQVRTMSADGNETFHRFSRTIQSVFLGQMDMILDEYNLFYSITESEQWKIGLIPKDSVLSSVIKAFEISGGDFIEVFKIHESNGDEILYEFHNIDFPEQLTDEEQNIFK